MSSFIVVLTTRTQGASGRMRYPWLHVHWPLRPFPYASLARGAAGLGRGGLIPVSMLTPPQRCLTNRCWREYDSHKPAPRFLRAARCRAWSPINYRFSWCSWSFSPGERRQEHLQNPPRIHGKLSHLHNETGVTSSRGVCSSRGLARFTVSARPSNSCWFKAAIASRARSPSR
jgi:hypothetical protein